MKFWDAAAVVPLLVEEAATPPLLQILDDDPDMLVWWATSVECTSALARRERDNVLSGDAARLAFERLRRLSAAWHEILPTDPIRSTAQRILRVHPLRAADALQLGAAVIAAENQPDRLDFVCLDERLADAALKEGFPLLARRQLL